MKLTEDQKKAKEAIIDFWKLEGDNLLTVGGYAGTGKTTVIAEAVKSVARKNRKKITFGFCTYTGRASVVLRSKLEAAKTLRVRDSCGTIHSMIYKPIYFKGKVVGWKPVDDIECDLIVIDEASMVNEDVFNDLKKYNRPILAVGDHGQLPPINGRFNLMERPDITLEKIHRQAEGNPIIKLSLMARNCERIPYCNYGDVAKKVSDENVLDRVSDLSDVLILCGFNKTRLGLNEYVRKRLGFSGKIPMVREKVICLKNNRLLGIYNGMVGILEKIEDKSGDWYNVHVNVEGDLFDGDAFKHQFGSKYTITEWKGMRGRDLGELFDWGYAMTVHKAQGTEAKKVVLFEERFRDMSDESWARWLYTGITRSSERLILVGKNN